MQKPAGVQYSDVDGMVTIVLPRIEGKRLVRLMAPYLTMALAAAVMFAFGVWIFGSNRAEVQEEVPLLPPLFLAFMALFFVMTAGSAAGFCFADRSVLIRADDEELTVISAGSLGHRRFRCRRDTITAMYADGFWLWIYGPHRPKHILWQRLPEERFWVAETLARVLGVRHTAPLLAEELEVRVIILDDDEIRCPPCPDRRWILDPNEWVAFLRIERNGAKLRLFQQYPTSIAFHRFFGLSGSEWLRWLPFTFKPSSEVLPQNVQWVQKSGHRCLQVSFVSRVNEQRQQLALVLWHDETGRLEQLHKTLTRASAVEE